MQNSLKIIGLIALIPLSLGSKESPKPDPKKASTLILESYIGKLKAQAQEKPRYCQYEINATDFSSPLNLEALKAEVLTTAMHFMATVPSVEYFLKPTEGEPILLLRDYETLERRQGPLTKALLRLLKTHCPAP